MSDREPYAADPSAPPGEFPPPQASAGTRLPSDPFAPSREFRSGASLGGASDAAYGAARRAVALGLVDEPALAEALRRHEESPGPGGLLALLPLSAEQRDALVGEGRPPLPPDVEAALRDPGRRVGRYVLLEKLGAGGMGAVFRAWDEPLGRAVALKLPRCPDDAHGGRLRREAALAASLEHPNIAKVFEVGEHRGAPFIAMQLVEGEALDAAARRAPLARRVRWLRDAAAAVAFAHARGVIHRDLKPANIMVDGSDHVFVLDFGLARRADAASASAPRLSDEAGTADYMAPEQAAGEPSRASDVYGLGATLYELATGRPPFAGATRADVLARVRVEEPVWPSRRAPGAPRDLDAIVLRCLEKEPARRYRDVPELIEDLDALLADEPLRHARRPTALRALARRVRRSPRPLAAAAVALAVAALGLVVAERARGRAEERAETAAARRLFEHGATLLAEGEAPEAEVFIAAALARAPRSPEGGDWRARLLEARARGARVAWTSPPVDAGGIALDAAGRRLAVWSLGGALRVFDLARGGEARALGDFAHQGHLALGPDGRRLATLTDGGVLAVFDLDAAAPRPVTLPADTMGELAFSPDGRRLAFSAPGGATSIFDLTGGALALVARLDFHASGGIAFAPDGRHLAAAACAGGDLAHPPRPGRAALLDIETGAATALPAGNYFAVAFDPSGRSLALGRGDGRILIVATATAAVEQVLRGHGEDVDGGAQVCGLAYAPADGRLLSWGCDGFVRAWTVARASGGPDLAVPCPQAPARYRAVAAAADGRTIATTTGAGAVRISELGRRREVRTLIGHGAAVHGVAFGPGDRVVSGDRDGGVRVFDAASGATLLALSAGLGQVAGVAASADGRWIAASTFASGSGAAVRVWDAATGELVRTLGAAGIGEAYGVAFSDRGELACACADEGFRLSGRGSVHIWDVASGAERAALPGREGWAVAFAPGGGRLFAAWQDNRIVVRDGTGAARLLAEIRSAPPKRPDPRGMDVSPDGRRLVVGGQGGLVRILDAERDDTVLAVSAPLHTRPINAVAWRRQGDLVASASDDGTVRLWDGRTLAPRGVLRGHDGAVDGVAFSADGALLASAGDDGAVRVWDVEATLRVLERATPEELLRESEEETGLRFDGERLEVAPP